MKDFNDKFSDCVLTDEDLEKVSGGVSSSGKRTVVVCPLCHVEKTYESTSGMYADVFPHYLHLRELGLIPHDSNLQTNLINYIQSAWDAATPVEE